MHNNTGKYLIALNTALNVNINWLLTGNGEMFVNADKNTFKPRNDISVNQKILTIGTRISELQKINNFKDKDMAKILGIFEEDYEGLKLGDRELTIKIINRFKQYFTITSDWLLYGE